MRDEAMRFIRRYGDAALAGALTALLLTQVALSEAPVASKISDAGVAIVLGFAAAWRTRVPLLFLGLIVAISAWFALGLAPAQSGTLGSAVLFAYIMLAIYSAAAHTSGRATILAGAMAIGLYVIDGVLLEPAPINPDSLVFLGLVIGAPWAAGRAVRSQRLNDRQLADERARSAAAKVEERARIARELHDVVAHSISVMVVQARGGRRVLESDPDDARAAFATIKRTGQQALDEMRRLLGMLRDQDEAMALAPQPTLKELDRLVQQVQASGLPVVVTIEGEPRDLPPGVDLSAYRIVQEALTNALMHAGPARARVLLRYGSDDLELEIADDGTGTGDASGSGYGLVGMRERVSVYGGELQAGRQPGGGYALRVRLPVRSAHA